MQIQKQRSKMMVVLATILMVVAIPISLAGLKSVNDLRNRAGEETPLAFQSDLSSSEFTSAFKGIPYQQTIELTGDLAPIADITLGCDPTLCSDSCTTVSHEPPSGLILSNDGQTLYWENPTAETEDMSWPVTVTASSPSPDDPSSTICVTQTFTLNYFESSSNHAPTCTLYPPAQPDYIPAGFSAPLRLEATDVDGGISSAQVTFSDETGVLETRTWDADNPTETLFLNKDSTPALAFTAQSTGLYTYSAEVTDTSGETAECAIYGDASINVVIPGENGSPVFTSDPYSQSIPATSLNIGQAYTYSIEATDPNGDTIDYFIVNTTGWLTFTVNDNAPGSFKGTFSGTPTAAGSYTAGIALNDGAHNHYSTQLWVINVNNPENDVPVVSVTLPPAGTSVTTDQTMRIEWTATDHNLIERFDVYLSSDPNNAASLIPLITGLGYNYNSYVWNVGSTIPGYYYIVVKATDNQSPAATGTGISHSFGISLPAQDIPPEQPVITGHPTITSLSPADRSEIEESDPLISADLTASDNALIESDTVAIKLDDTDITALSTIEGADTHNGSFMYRPSPPLAAGSHRVSVSFEDTSTQAVSKTWTFTIIETEQGDDQGEDTETFTIFGLEIPKRIAIIVGIGLLLLIIALVIPWLFYAAWKGSKDENETEFVDYSPRNEWPQKGLDEPVPDLPEIELKVNKNEPVILETKVEELRETPRPAEKKADTVTTVETHTTSSFPRTWINATPDDSVKKDISTTTASSPIISENAPIIPAHTADLQREPDSTHATTDTKPIDAKPEQDDEENVEKLQEALNEISKEQGFLPDDALPKGQSTVKSTPETNPSPASQPTKTEEPALITSPKPNLGPADVKSNSNEEDPNPPRPITPMPK